MHIGERVKKIRLYNDLNQAQFAEKLGLTQGFISKVEKNNTQLTVDHLILIENIFSVDLDWLLTGKGEMIKRPFRIQEKPEGYQVILLDVDKQQNILMSRLRRILAEGDKTKIEAVKGVLKAFDPGEKKQSGTHENDGGGGYMGGGVA